MAELAMADIDKWVEVFRQQIEQRNLPRGYRMESIRAAASRCGLSRYAMTAVYERLEAMGVLEARQGSGFYVCRTPQAVRNSSSFPTDDVLDVPLLQLRLCRTEDAQNLLVNTGDVLSDGLQIIRWADQIRRHGIGVEQVVLHQLVSFYLRTEKRLHLLRLKGILL